MKSKVALVVEKLNENLVERDGVIRLALLAAFAGENIVLVGPPGTAKSEIARRLSLALSDDDEYFEYLLTRFSTPEEIFGPLSITALKEDRYHRNTKGYLPSVRVAFLDEIFKANSSILNSLLTVLNERKFHNGSDRVDIPLKTLIAASNELPDGDDALAALYDRFLLRKRLDGVDDTRALFSVSDEPIAFPSKLKISADELNEVAKKRMDVILTNEIQEALLDIREQHKKQFADDPDEDISDRRFMKMLKLLKTSAVTNGRDKVDFSDLYLLPCCLWNKPESAQAVENIVKRIVPKHLIQFAVTQFASLIEKPEGTLPTISDAAGENPPNEFLEGIRLKKPDFVIRNTEDWFHFCVTTSLHVKGKLIRQAADLDFSSVEVCRHVESFNGVYDGNGCTISNFSLTEESNLDFAGLFTNLEADGVIEDLKLEDINIKSKKCAGALVGKAKGHISNVSIIRGNIESISASVGGVIGEAESLKLSDVKAIDMIIIGRGCVGGLVGHGSRVSIENSKVMGLFIRHEDDLFSGMVSIAAAFFCGGIVGRIDDEASEIKECLVENLKIESDLTGASGGISGHAISCKIITCAVVGSSINSASCSVGGIVGVLDGGEVSDCAVSQLKTQKALYLGGVVGKSENAKAELNRCFVQGLNAVSHYKGGIVGYCGDTTVEGCVFYSTPFDVDNRSFLIADSNKVKDCWAMRQKGATEDHNVRNGKRLLKEQSSQQRFYEDTLGWDFKSIWRMDKKTGFPALQLTVSDGVLREGGGLELAELVLNQLVVENIWLDGVRL